MTVKQMIEALKDLPQDAKVVGFVSYDDWSGCNRAVTSITYDSRSHTVDVSANSMGEVFEVE